MSKSYCKILPVFFFLSTLIGVAQNKQEITIKLYTVSSEKANEEFEHAEYLRKNNNYERAIESYTDIINSDADEKVKAESFYNIGFCYMKNGEYELAENVFNELIAEYPDNEEAVGFSSFCLAEIDIWKGNSTNALKRLNNIVEQESVSDDFCAAAQLKVVDIYLLEQNDKSNAKNIFNDLVKKYKDTKAVNNTLIEQYNKILN